MLPAITRFIFSTLMLSLWLQGCGGGGGASSPGPIPPQPEVVEPEPQPEPADAADVVLRNGVIYTIDSENTIAQELALKDGVITYVGDSGGAAGLIGSQTRVIELDGRSVMPGIHDSHVHPLEAGSAVSGTCFVDQSVDILSELFQQQLQNCAPNQRGGIDWVLGYGHSIFQLLELPSDVRPRDILDDAIPDRPVVFIEETSHSVWANSAALEMAGIDRFSENPVGGVIGKDLNGEPNGLLLDNAGDILFDMAFLPPTDTLLQLHYEGLLFALELIARNGITSIVNARLYTRRGYLDVWRRAEQQGTLTARTVIGLWAYPTLLAGETDADQILFLSDLYSNDPDSLLRVSQIKFYSDGIHINETAATLEPYPPEARMPFFVSADNRGLNYFTEDRLANYISQLELVGFDAHIHAIGDRAVRESLNAIEAAQSRNGVSVPRRHRLTHLEEVSPADYGRFVELDIIADFQVAGEWTLPAPGASADGFIPVRSIWETGARVVLSSDWDVSSLSPFVGIENSLNRAEESLPDVLSAVRAYTIDAAYLSRSEERTGSLEVGKLADLIVLDQDIFNIPTEQISDTRVLLTLLGGQDVYRANGFADQ